MVKSNSIKYHPSITAIKLNQAKRYLKAGAILHVMALAGLFIFLFGLQNSIFYFNQQMDFNAYKWMFISIYGFTIPFFAEFDALGRYQNYKQIKDKMFILGFDTRLIKPFMHSRCQRDAVIVAATDINIKKEVKDYYYNMGYRWYHILPDTFLNKPLILFKKEFWTRILFTKYYQLQNFYW